MGRPNRFYVRLLHYHITNLDLRYDQRQFLKFKSQLSREYPSNVPIFLSHENCNWLDEEKYFALSSNTWSLKAIVLVWTDILLRCLSVFDKKVAQGYLRLNLRRVARPNLVTWKRTFEKAKSGAITASAAYSTHFEIHAWLAVHSGTILIRATLDSSCFHACLYLPNMIDISVWGIEASHYSVHLLHNTLRYLKILVVRYAYLRRIRCKFALCHRFY